MMAKGDFEKAVSPDGFGATFRQLFDDPAKLARFVSFVNAPGTPDPHITFRSARDQAVPEELLYEQPLAPKATIDTLVALGHGIRQSDAIGDVQAVMIDRGKLVAVSDARHGGAAGAY